MNLFTSGNRMRGLVVAALLVTAAVPAQAAWSLAFKGGIVPITDGDVHRGPSFDGSILLGLPAGSLPVAVQAKSFDDVYGDFSEFGLELGYTGTGPLRYTLGLSRLHAGAGSLRVGTVAGSLPLNGRFSAYEDLHLYAGINYTFNPTGTWRPYVGAQIGVKRVDAITATFSVPNTPFNEPYRTALTNAAFYDRTDAFTYGVVAGVEYALSDRFSAALETGYFGQGSLDDDDRVLGLLGLNALNDEGSLGYVPVRLSLRWSF